MPENPFVEKLKQLVVDTIKQELPHMMKDQLGQQIEEHVDALVPLEVARQLHKAIDGDPLEITKVPRGGSKRGGRGARKGRKLGKRPRCEKCSKVKRKQDDGSWACESCPPA